MNSRSRTSIALVLMALPLLATAAHAQNTHINRPIGDFVVLGGSSGPSSSGAFVGIDERLLANGKIESFSVPPGKALVVTDILVLMSGGIAGSRVTLSLLRRGPADPIFNPENFAWHGPRQVVDSVGVSYAGSMTTGFVVDAGTELIFSAQSTSHFSGTVVTVQGYLVQAAGRTQAPTRSPTESEIPAAGAVEE